MYCRNITAVNAIRTFQTSASLFMPKKKNSSLGSTSCGKASPENEGPVVECKTGIKIHIIVKPGAKKNSVTDIGSEINIQITAPPVDGQANQELLKYLSKILDVKKTQLNLEKGAKSRNKTIIVNDTCTEYILQKFQDEIG
ncbi:hypothetical protein ACF0H5_013740 [Mactra antiquata]